MSPRYGFVLRWALAGCVLIASGAWAQEPAPWLQMTVVAVDPGRVDEFLAAQGELSELDEAAGVPWRSVARTAIFGETYQFVITSPLESFASLERTRDDPQRAGVIARIRHTVIDRRTYALRTTPTLDNPLPLEDSPALMLVQIVSVVPGREQEYLQVMADEVLPHFDEAEMHHRSGAVTFGGEGGYVHLFHVGRLATLDQGSPLARALGADGAQEVTAKLSGIVTRSDQWLVQYLSDVSFRPEPEEVSP